MKSTVSEIFYLLNFVFIHGRDKERENESNTDDRKENDRKN
jgi:hypothetical protein